MTELIPAGLNIWYSEMRLEALDLGVRGAVIIGSQRVFVFDTFTRPLDMQPVVQLARGKPIIAIYSHADWDHIWGTAGLACQDVAAHLGALQRFEDAQDVPAMLAKMRQESPGTFDDVHLVAPTITFSERLDLDAGGLSLQLHALPGHTADSIVGFIPQLGILLGGDAVEDPLPLVNDAGRLPGWISGLEMWARHPGVKVVAPAHGALSSRTLLEQNIAYLKGLADGSSPVPQGLDDFYSQAHANNLRLAHPGRPGTV
jgi:glyoxylase-like metal-dependent hydrolase (beta-lactamase superfamily II)